MSLTIVPFEDHHHAAFAALNLEWIERHFAVEPEDSKVLDNPRAQIIEPGGAIFMALDDLEPVGTAAMIPHGAGFELAKMAVTPTQRGRGIGQRLMRACLGFAKLRNATEVTLLTNDILQPAVSLYRSFGFEQLETMIDDRYARGNVEMRLTLDRYESV